MKVNNISTLALNNNLRASTLLQQNQFVNAQKEVATGLKSDIGRDLGAFTSSAISVETEIEYIEQLKTTNSFVENRLKTMQLGIDTIVDSANNFMSQVTAQMSSSIDRGILETLGKTSFGTLQSTINVTVKGEYVFSGVNSDSSALVDYEGADGAAAKTAVQTAFATTFGFPTTDPNAANITPAAMKAFIDGPFADLFNDANWGTLWSGSSEFGTRSKISSRELVETPTTANAQGFRNSAAAMVLFAEFSNTAISEPTMNQIADSAFALVGSSIGELGIEQSKLGLVEERVETANERMDFQKTILANQLSGLVEVDPYEAATKLNQLTSNLQANYAVTARIQNLSLLNFL